MKKLIALSKTIAHDIIIMALALTFLFFIDMGIKQVKANEVPNYADSTGCAAEDYDFNNCA